MAMRDDMREFIWAAFAFWAGAQIPILVILYVAYEAWKVFK